MMKSSLLKAALVLVLVGTGCSKSVNHEGGRFSQTEPEPPTSPTPSPTVSPTPSPTVSPTPTPTPTVGCVAGALGDAVEYSVIAREDVKISNAAVLKRVAATDASVDHASIGLLLSKNKKRADLQTVYSLNVDRTKVKRGRATYGKGFTERKSKAYGGFSQESFSLDPLLKQVQTFAKYCAPMPVNTKVVSYCVKPKKGKPEICGLRIIGSEKGVNIAEISSEQLKGVSIISVEIPKGATLVSNMEDVKKADFKKLAVVFPGVLKKNFPKNVFWNMPNAEALSFTNTAFFGTVIAPEAEVTVCGEIGIAGFWSRTVSVKSATF